MVRSVLTESVRATTSVLFVGFAHASLFTSLAHTSVPIRNPGKPEMQVTPRYLSRNVQENLGKLAFPILLLLPDGDIKLPVKARGLLSVTHSHFSLVSSSDLFELWSVRFNFTSKLFITLNTADICINILPKFSLSRDNQ